MGKWSKFDNQIKSLSKTNSVATDIARRLFKFSNELPTDKQLESLTAYVRDRIKILALLEDDTLINSGGKNPPQLPEDNKFKTKENDKGKELTYEGSTCITSLEDAIAFFQVDLTKFKVKSWVCNSWDVTMKNNDDILNPIKRTNYQVKLNLEPLTIDFNKLQTMLINDMDKYSPKYPKIKYNKHKDAHCFVFDPADIHIGKICDSFSTGDDYNNQIAVKRVREGLYKLIDQTKPYPLEKIIFIMGNDILHVDGNTNATTKGTKQDVDGMWYNAFLMAKDLLVEIIETLMQIAPVEVVYNPSNHDYHSGFYLADSIASWFRRSKDVSFNNDLTHRKYTLFGNNLIGSTHMDGAKPKDLPQLMAEDVPDLWAKAKHRYFIGHHIHHENSKDYGSVNVESFRSPSGTDTWHDKFGYRHSPKAIEGRIHHKNDGLVAKLIAIF